MCWGEREKHTRIHTHFWHVIRWCSYNISNANHKDACNKRPLDKVSALQHVCSISSWFESIHSRWSGLLIFILFDGFSSFGKMWKEFYSFNHQWKNSCYIYIILSRPFPHHPRNWWFISSLFTFWRLNCWCAWLCVYVCINHKLLTCKKIVHHTKTCPETA